MKINVSVSHEDLMEDIRFYGSHGEDMEVVELIRERADVVEYFISELNLLKGRMENDPRASAQDIAKEIDSFEKRIKELLETEEQCE